MPLRDQQRALHAYQSIAEVPSTDRGNYKIAVNDLGTNILRSGLCAAIANVQRLGKRGDVLLGHLAGASVPGLERATAKTLAEQVRLLDADSYIIATREMLQVATWLKRAVQATFDEG